VGSRSVLDGTENLASIGIRSPDHPARSESLYRLNYPGTQVFWYMRKCNFVNYDLP